LRQLHASREQRRPRFRDGAKRQRHNGQLGTGDTTDVNTPTVIDAAHFGGAPIAAVTCGHNHTLAITRGEGRLYWGNVREWRHWPRAHGRRHDAAARG